MLKYKGYTGYLQVDTKANILYGKVLDIKDVMTFQGKSVEEATTAFEESIDDYLEFCTELGKSPDKPFSGKFHFRTTPEIHRQITIAATKEGKSINTWIEEVVKKEAEKVISCH